MSAGTALGLISFLSAEMAMREDYQRYVIKFLAESPECRASIELMARSYPELRKKELPSIARLRFAVERVLCRRNVVERTPDG